MSQISGALSRMHGLHLVGVFFLDYLFSSAFSHDLLQTLVNITLEYISSHHLIHSFTSLSALLQQLVCRVGECVVLAALLKSRVGVFQDAVMLHLLFPQVQRYHFNRFWLTRLVHRVGGFLFPRVLRHFTSESVPGVVPLESVKKDCTATARLYRECYENSVPYAVMVNGMVWELAHALVTQSMLAVAFFRDRGKRTSRWRLLKPYLCNVSESVAQIPLVYTARVAGAWVGRYISRDPTSSTLFWCERLALLAATPFIHRSGSAVAVWLRERLELLHPATVEDEREDLREQEAEAEAEAEAEESQGWNSYFGAAGQAGAPPTVDYYTVLGTHPSASSAEIKRAYRKAALQNHPDRAPHDPDAQKEAWEKMTAINEAYETLVSDTRRRRYDMSRLVGDAPPRMQHFTRTSLTATVGLGAVSIVGISAMGSVILYTEYITAFYNLTGPGRLPLRFLHLL